VLNFSRLNFSRFNFSRLLFFGKAEMVGTLYEEYSFFFVISIIFFVIPNLFVRDLCLLEFLKKQKNIPSLARI
jgi:hypothetical protein